MAFIHLELLYMGGIYSSGLIVLGWNLFNRDLLYMGVIYTNELIVHGGIYSSGLIVHGLHLFIWTYCTWVSFTHMD